MWSSMIQFSHTVTYYKHNLGSCDHLGITWSCGITQCACMFSYWLYKVTWPCKLNHVIVCDRVGWHVTMWDCVGSHVSVWITCEHVGSHVLACWVMWLYGTTCSPSHTILWSNHTTLDMWSHVSSRAIVQGHTLNHTIVWDHMWHDLLHVITWDHMLRLAPFPEKIPGPLLLIHTANNR